MGVRVYENGEGTCAGDQDAVQHVLDDNDTAFASTCGGLQDTSLHDKCGAGKTQICTVHYSFTDTFTNPVQEQNFINEGRFYQDSNANVNNWPAFKANPQYHTYLRVDLEQPHHVHQVVLRSGYWSERAKINAVYAGSDFFHATENNFHCQSDTNDR
jgi:hypothetical protein